MPEGAPHFDFDDEDVAERLDKGLVDFGLFVGDTDLNKYDYIRSAVMRGKKGWNTIPVRTWGLLIREDHPLAAKEAITPEDVRGVPLLCSRQSLGRNELSGWLGRVVAWKKGQSFSRSARAFLHCLQETICKPT